MAVEVRIPTILRTFTGGEKAVQGDGTTLLQVIDDIDGRNPGLKERLVESENLRRFVNVYVNDEDVRFSGGLRPPPPTATSSSCSRPSPAAERLAPVTRYASLERLGRAHPAGRPAQPVAESRRCGCGPSWRTATRPGPSRTGRR